MLLAVKFPTQKIHNIKSLSDNVDKKNTIIRNNFGTFVGFCLFYHIYICMQYYLQYFACPYPVFLHWIDIEQKRVTTRINSYIKYRNKDISGLRENNPPHE